MAGTTHGGKKTAATNKLRHGDDYYREIGRLGGLAKSKYPKGFAANRELARIAGAKGGRISKRRPAAKPTGGSLDETHR